MRKLLAILLVCVAPATAQQPTDYQKLMHGYIETFRILGRSRICKLDFDAAPHFQEVARRHGEQSEPVRIARLAFAAGAENLMLDRELEPAPRAPMPCDVMVYMRGMGLPPLPASLGN